MEDSRHRPADGCGAGLGLQEGRRRDSRDQGIGRNPYSGDRMELDDSRQRSRKMSLIYGLGVILLVILLVIGQESLTGGLILFLCFIPLFIFSRYLMRHGGMGWQWPA
ncbi:MAG: hypothetical protein NWE89_02200 [Candidatus Bathyarchaeota archaeon]|nr:hypothetical protein [Candidatus Bathyarchaeota archaeon]